MTFNWYLFERNKRNNCKRK